MRAAEITAMFMITAIAVAPAQKCRNPPDGGCTITYNSTGTSIRVGKSVRYRCIIGYKVKGEDNSVVTVNVECLPGPIWDEPIPECEPMACGPLPTGTNTAPVPTTEFIPGDQYTYACLPGYNTTDPMVNSCQLDQSWSLDSGPNCTEITCPGPENGVNTKMVPADIQDGMVFQQTFTYRCKIGFSTNNDTVVVCMENGQLSIPPPRCEAIVCSLTNGVNTENAPAFLPWGLTYEYKCLPGYTTADDTCTACTSIGLSVPDAPVCTAVYCGKPPDGPMTEPVPADTNLTSLQTYTYSCLPGLVTVDETCTVCLPNGKLSLATAPTCEFIICGVPPEGTNTMDSQNYTLAYPDVYIYECEEGYTTDDEVISFCLASGNFSLETPPNCIAVQCPRPPPGINTVPPPANETFVFGDTFTYECAPWYELAEEITITCESNGQWSLFTRLVCTPAEGVCSLPPPGVNTKAPAPDTPRNEGDSYTYECLDGFVPFIDDQDMMVTVCNSTEWTPMVPPTCTLECTSFVDVTVSIIPGTGCTQLYQTMADDSPVLVTSPEGKTFSNDLCACTTELTCCPVP